MKKTVAELSTSLDAHEQVCSERSKSIEIQFAGVNARLKHHSNDWPCNTRLGERFNRRLEMESNAGI